MKVKTITVVLLTSFAVAALSGCNNGHSTTSGTNSVQSAAVKGSIVGTPINDDAINSFSNNFANSIKQSMSGNTLSPGIGAQLTMGLKSMLTEGISSFVLGSVMNLIFPPSDPNAPIIAMLDQIIKTLDDMQNKLDNLAAVTNSTFSFVTAAHLQDYKNTYDTAFANIRNIDNRWLIFLNTITYQSENYGQLYQDSKLDFKIPTGEKDAQGNPTYKTNDSLIKVMIYVAQTQQASIDKVFTPANMQTLDNTLEDYTNLNDADAFSSDAAMRSKLSAAHKLKATNLNIVPNLVRTLSTNIVADASQSTPQFNATPETSYKYASMYPDNFKTVKYERNRLGSYLVLNAQVNALEISVLDGVAMIQKLQNYSLILRYLGGDQNVAVPAYMDLYFTGLEQQAIAQDKIANDMQNDQATRDAATAKSTEIRMTIFDEATNMLSKSVAKRLAHIHDVLNNPKSYDSKFQDLKDDSEIDEQAGGTQVTHKSFYVPGWDFIRGAGIYAENSGNPVAARITESQPFYKVMTANGSVEMSMTDMVKNSEVYWDGTFLKFPNAVKNQYTMQALGQICNPDSNGAYRVSIMNDAMGEAAYMYCNPSDINYDGILKVTGDMADGKSKVAKIYLANDNQMSFGQSYMTLEYPLANPTGFRFADDNLYVKNSNDSTKPVKVIAQKDILTGGSVVDVKIYQKPYFAYYGDRREYADLHYWDINPSFKDYSLDYTKLGTASGYTDYLAYKPIYTGYGLTFAKFQTKGSNRGTGLGFLAKDFYLKASSAETSGVDHVDSFLYDVAHTYKQIAKPNFEITYKKDLNGTPNSGDGWLSSDSGETSIATYSDMDNTLYYPSRAWAHLSSGIEQTRMICTFGNQKFDC